MTRLRECEELLRHTERKVWSSYSRLEETTAKAVETIKKDGDTARSKAAAATADVRSGEPRQSLHTA